MVVQDGFKGQAGDNMTNRCPCRLTTSSGVVITQCHDCVIRREKSRCRISFCAEGTIVYSQKMRKIDQSSVNLPGPALWLGGSHG